MMLISDYGMTDVQDLVPVFLDEFIDMDQLQYVILSSGYAALIPYALTHPKVKEV